MHGDIHGEHSEGNPAQTKANVNSARSPVSHARLRMAAQPHLPKSFVPNRITPMLCYIDSKGPNSLAQQSNTATWEIGSRVANAEGTRLRLLGVECEFRYLFTLNTGLLNGVSTLLLGRQLAEMLNVTPDAVLQPKGPPLTASSDDLALPEVSYR